MVFMKVIIHDLHESAFRELFPEEMDDTRIIYEDSTINHCIGCFGCWVKTPAECIIRDAYGDMGEILSKCHEMVVISKCVYGGFSPFVKNVLDRSISYIHPYFVIRKGEMHHKKRYKNTFDFHAYFYGDEIADSEKDIAERLIRGNAVNFDSKHSSVHFFRQYEELRGQRI